MNLHNDPLLSVKNLTTRLKIGHHAFPVVEDISFDLHRGRTLALVGESGCGKTMTALSLLGILPYPPALPPEGQILYQGRDLLRLSDKQMRSLRGGKIAMVFQDPISALNPVYMVGSQMAEAAELHLALYGEEALERAAQALAEVGIASAKDILKAYPHELSGGMKQRVMIGMALMCEPDVLIADEPTTALDVTIQAQVLDLIRRLQKSKGMALLLITHDMGVVAEMADEVIVMYAAQGVEHASAVDLFDQGSHPYTMGLLDSRPGKGIPKQTLRAIKGTVPPLTHFPSGCRFHPRCPYVMEKCKHAEVPQFSIPSPHNGAVPHTAKCWLYDGSEESRQKKELK